MRVITIIILLLPALLQSQWDEAINCEELNTKYDEFAPYYDKYRQILIFNSTKTNESKYFVSNFKNNKFSQPKIMNSPLNKSDGNLSYFSLSAEDISYISKFRNTSKRSYLNIYKSKYIKNAWSEPYLDSNFISDSFCSHPTVSDNGNVIIFSSNYEKSGKQRDTDLWISYRIELDNWSKPERIEILNSYGNEITPYFKGNDTLYFSSNGLGGPGGYDIYYSINDKGIWQKPRPISVNTEFDESDPAILGDMLLFSSNRPGGVGGLDIYKAYRISQKNHSPTKKISPINVLLQTTNVRLNILRKKQILASSGYLPEFIFNDTFRYGSAKILEQSHKKIRDFISKNNDLEIEINPNNNSISQHISNAAFVYSESLPINIFKILAPKSLLSEVNHFEDSIIVIPPVLDLRLSGNNNHNSSKLIIRLLTKQSNNSSSILYDSIYSDRIYVELDPIKDKLIDLDEMEIEVNSYSENEIIGTGKIKVNLGKSISEQKKLIIEDNIHFEIFEFSLLGKHDLSDDSLSNLLSNIANSSQISNRIIIQYNSQIHYSLAQKLCENIKNKSNQDLNFEHEIDTSIVSHSDLIIFRIKIEKFRN